MKDFTKEEYEKVPDESIFDIIEHINYCLDRLFDDKTKTHNDNVVDDLTYEEIIGVLQQSKNYLKNEIVYIGE